jgi:hypothetical protein
MKKLKLDLRNFENIEVLTRNQLKNVIGGSGGTGGGTSGTCIQWYYFPSNPIRHTSTFTVSGTCGQQSAGMNSLCVSLIDNGIVSRCGYDCACDGWGS